LLCHHRPFGAWIWDQPFLTSQDAQVDLLKVCGRVHAEPVRQDTGAQFGQPRRGHVREVTSGRVRERLSPPQVQCVPQDQRGGPGIAVRQSAVPLTGQRFEGRHVDRVRPHREPVSGQICSANDPVGTTRPASSCT
jgi:hypothetical protein